MALKGKGKRAVQAAVDYFTPFDHGTLSGRWVDSVTLAEWGHLPAVYLAALADEVEAKGKVFVIFSYRTPIAWCAAQPLIRKWSLPEVRYSVTTTNHQNVVRVAAHNPGFYANARW